MGRLRNAFRDVDSRVFRYFGVVENVKTFLANSMETWRIMLYAGDFE